MFYEQHKFVGDSVLVGANVFLPKKYAARGRIVFARKEIIEHTRRTFLEEVRTYNKGAAKLTIDKLREKAEHGELKLEVRRSFGDVNAWSGDHSKLNPPNGKTSKFKNLDIRLQEIAYRVDIDYLKLALGNWDHFMPLSYNIWANFHKQAVRLATAFAERSTNKKAFRKGYLTDGKTPAVVFDLEENDLARALFLEAYGCHFLEDCFAAGHLRTPRLLFGFSPLVAARSLAMHDEDNKRRLWGFSASKRAFRLIGEDEKKDDFRKLSQGKKDPVMQQLMTEVVETVSASVQQVLDAAFNPKGARKVGFAAVKNRIPQVKVFWRALDKKRSRTHALEIWPVATHKTPNPLYKIHADYNSKNGSFKDPMLIKRRSNGSWRRVYLGDDLEAFTPGARLAWWIPRKPEEERILP